MSPTWQSEEPPNEQAPNLAGKFRALWRGSLLIFVLVMGVVATLLLRPFELLRDKRTRPWTGWITVWVCRAALRLFGIHVETRGHPLQEPGVLVANHSSWIDIFVLNAVAPLYFVSKAEVSKWPGIGWLARLTGTAFVRREAREAGRQATQLKERIIAGHRLLFFPEGTSTDGQRVLPFKSTLFATVFSAELGDDVSVQPVTVTYTPPKESDPRFYGWWGDMEFGPHLFRILASKGRGSVAVTWHVPLKVREFNDRKALAKQAEFAVRSAHPSGRAN